MKKQIRAVVLLILIFGGVIVVPSASAEEVPALPAQSAHGFFEWASARGGEEVTAAECIEKGDPDYWSSLSDK
ncbi:MAG: hypothetical protein ABFC38_05670 [Methanospirillum sp.]